MNLKDNYLKGSGEFVLSGQYDVLRSESKNVRK